MDASLDGSLTLRAAGTDVVFYFPIGNELQHTIQLLFKALSEYEGLIAGLSITAGLGIQQLLIKGDSQLIVNQTKKAH